MKQVRCRICNAPELRLKVTEKHLQGSVPYRICKELASEGISIHVDVISRHLREHETTPEVWYGLGVTKFNSEEQRKKHEAQFLSRVSLVTELWDKYTVLSEIFVGAIGKPNDLRPGATTEFGIDQAAKLSKEMRSYLEGMLKLQKERDIVIEVAKVVLFMIADNLVARLRFVVNDLPLERRELVGRIIKEEVKNALEYAKKLGGENVDKLLGKVNDEYDKLVVQVVNQ